MSVGAGAGSLTACQSSSNAPEVFVERQATWPSPTVKVAMRSACAYGNGAISTFRITLNMVVPAPIPRARESVTTAVKHLRGEKVEEQPAAERAKAIDDKLAAEREKPAT